MLETISETSFKNTFLLKPDVALKRTMGKSDDSASSTTFFKRLPHLQLNPLCSIPPYNVSLSDFEVSLLLS